MKLCSGIAGGVIDGASFKILASLAVGGVFVAGRKAQITRDATRLAVDRRNQTADVVHSARGWAGCRQEHGASFEGLGLPRGCAKAQHRYYGRTWWTCHSGLIR